MRELSTRLEYAAHKSLADCNLAIDADGGVTKGNKASHQDGSGKESDESCHSGLMYGIGRTSLRSVLIYNVVQNSSPGNQHISLPVPTLRREQVECIAWRADAIIIICMPAVSQKATSESASPELLLLVEHPFVAGHIIEVSAYM